MDSTDVPYSKIFIHKFKHIHDDGDVVEYRAEIPDIFEGMRTVLVMPWQLYSAGEVRKKVEEAVKDFVVAWIASTGCIVVGTETITVKTAEEMESLKNPS